MSISLNNVNSEVVRAHNRIDTLFKKASVIYNTPIIVPNSSSYKFICDIKPSTKLLLVKWFTDSDSREQFFQSTMIPNAHSLVYYDLAYNDDNGMGQEKLVLKLDANKLYARQITFGNFSNTNNGIIEVVSIE